MNTTTFTYTDPREFDGSPFDAAHGAGEQLSSLLKLAKTATADTFVLARVAELQRQQDAGQEPNARAFEDGPLGKTLRVLESDIQKLALRAEVITRAASFDPANPPKED